MDSTVLNANGTQPCISKSRFLQGLQCQKLLWFVYNSKDQLPEPDNSQQAIFDQAHAVGDLAKQMYSDGVEVGAGITEFDEALRSTQQLLKLRRPLFEAAFRANGGYGRVDILVPAPNDRWDLIEVKSTTAVKDVHLTDLAFQAWVLAAAGVKLRRCQLMHINAAYVRRGQVDPKQFFTLVDLSVEVSRLNCTIEDKLADVRKTISRPVVPVVSIGPHCDNPYTCPIHDQCWAFLREHNVTTLYRSGKKKFKLLANGIVDIKDIPEDFRLTANQKIQRQAVVSGQPHIDRVAIGSFLKRLKYPLGFMDFETYALAIPPFDGVRPYQQIPFQFSLHVVRSPGAEPEHYGFLAEDRRDPRPEFMRRLRALLPESGSVIAYNSGFELDRLEECCELLREHQTWFRQVKRRTVDLLRPFRGFRYYSPSQFGSASMKVVLPALTGCSYAHLEIQQGGQASTEFLRTHFGDVAEDERQKVRWQLERYCHQDTHGMFEIVEALRNLANQVS